MAAFEIVMESRRKLVEQVIENMKKGYLFTKEGWDAGALSPHNPLSNARYQGGNRIRLIHEVKSYIYEQSSEIIAQQKGSPTQACLDSRYRNRPID